MLVPLSVPQEPSKLPQPSTAPALPQVSSAVGVMNGSQVHVPGTKAQLHASFSTATLLTHFSSMFDSGQVGTNQVWGACHLPTRSLPEQAYNAPPTYVGNVSQPESTAPLPDGSKAPGYRSASQRIISSPIGELFLTDSLIENQRI